MCLYSWLKRLICRRLLTLVFFSYFLMIVMFLFSSDFTEPDSNAEESFALMFPEPTFYTKRESPSYFANHSYHGHRNEIKSHFEVRSSKLRKENVFGFSENIEMMVKFQEPVPLLEPMLDQKVQGRRDGDFMFLGKGTYVYSAFLDDRKEQHFIRIMTLMSQRAVEQKLYCHFNNTVIVKPKVSELYQLCENHNKVYGGYFYSCQIPVDIKTSDQLTSILISLTETGPKIKMPLHSVQPPESKLEYLDRYPQGSVLPDKINFKNEKIKLNVPSVQGNTNNPPLKSEESPSHRPLSFAICVSPLFGNISVHRLVEFVELSRLLGADHFIFYNHSVPQQVSNVLLYYISKNIASVLPWNLPSDVDSVWYFGQLLANNDCLYRTIPHFDLVSFNDIDEFIVPHSNTSSWKDAFSSLLTENHCGFSFQSAFYDPGIRETFDTTLLTPVLTAKSGMYSKVRTKVMVCPWRVFEVGIHHISKQNREEWRPLGIPPSIAYLHHYRRCVANFGMRCNVWEKDLIIADRYLRNLTANYETELNNILFPQIN